MLELSQKLKTSRQKKGLSFDDVVKLAKEKHPHSKINKTMLSRWENAKINPNIENLLILSSLYGVSMDYLTKDTLHFFNGLYYLDSVLKALELSEEEKENYKKIGLLLFLGIDIKSLKGQEGLNTLHGFASLVPSLSATVVGAGAFKNEFFEALEAYPSIFEKLNL